MATSTTEKILQNLCNTDIYYTHSDLETLRETINWQEYGYDGRCVIPFGKKDQEEKGMMRVERYKACCEADAALCVSVEKGTYNRNKSI